MAWADFGRSNELFGLGAADANGSITVKDSEFSHNGNGDGLTHNLYAGAIKQLTIQDSYFHDAVVGHEIKSRALSTTITGSRIQDNSGDASYAIDLPQGGNALIQGNTIQKGVNALNPVIIAFGEEGNLNPNSSLAVRGNTIVNDDPKGIAVWNASSAKATMEGNRVFGMGRAPANRGTVGQTGTMALTTCPVLSLASPVDTVQATLVFNVSEDAWNGNAQAYFRLDGQQLGGVQAITASHALDKVQKLSFLVPLPAGPHTASVMFVNHAAGATAAASRNLHVSSIDIGARHLALATALKANGTASFTIPALPATAMGALPGNSLMAHIASMPAS